MQLTRHSEHRETTNLKKLVLPPVFWMNWLWKVRLVCLVTKPSTFQNYKKSTIFNPTSPLLQPSHPLPPPLPFVDSQSYRMFALLSHEHKDESCVGLRSIQLQLNCKVRTWWTLQRNFMSMVHCWRVHATRLNSSQDRRIRKSSYPFCPSRTTRRASPSRVLIHLMPCSCGSIISGHRSQFVKIVAFSVDIRSLGKFSLFHVAMVALSVNSDSGSRSSVKAIGAWKRKFASVKQTPQYGGRKGQDEITARRIPQSI